MKYGYSNFKLDILEYCNAASIVEREQFYLDNLKLEYNTLKFARSFTGFRHSVSSRERMRISRLGKPCSENTKLKLSANSQAIPVLVKNNNTGEVTKFVSVRKASKFIGKQNSYITKCLKKRKIYRGKEFTIYL